MQLCVQACVGVYTYKRINISTPGILLHLCTLLVFYCICVQSALHCTKISLFQLSDMKNSRACDEHIQILAKVILAAIELLASRQTVKSCGLCIFETAPSTRRMNILNLHDGHSCICKCTAFLFREFIIFEQK